MALAALWSASGCSDDCCTVDGEPISLKATSDGALWVRLRDTKGAAGEGWGLLDTSAPVSYWNEVPRGTPEVNPRSFDVLSEDGEVVRARFRDVWALGAPLAQPTEVAARQADGARAAVPNLVAQELEGLPVLAVLGGEFWRNFASIVDRTPDAGTPTVSLWPQQPATTGFLDRSQYAVLEVDLYGGGQLNADGEPDFLGLRGPHQFPGSQMLLRGCAAPSAFVAATETLPQCCRGEARTLATGTDVALALATGVGGVMMSEASWARVALALGQVPASLPAEPAFVYHPNEPDVIVGRRMSLPRLALVNLEVPVGQDEGACVELGRARRTELVALSQTRSSSTAHCPPPCDRDPRDPGKGMASAAYVEIDEEIPVTVVPDGTRMLQALRAEVRPEGPELDGLLGVSALKSLRIELDYRPRPARLIFSCQPGESETCRAVGRCPRLPNKDSTRVCFGLPAHKLPETCDNSATCL